MQRQRTSYDSPVDAIVVLAKRLSIYEDRNSLASEDFFTNSPKVCYQDSIEFVEWSNDYQHFLALKVELEERLSHAA